MKTKELIQQGENSVIEFKRADVRPESLAKEIIAFANGHGGVILVGIDDNGNVLGVEQNFTKADDFSNWVPMCYEP